MTRLRRVRGDELVPADPMTMLWGFLLGLVIPPAGVVVGLVMRGRGEKGSAGIVIFGLAMVVVWAIVAAVLLDF